MATEFSQLELFKVSSILSVPKPLAHILFSCHTVLMWQTLRPGLDIMSILTTTSFAFPSSNEKGIVLVNFSDTVKLSYILVYVNTVLSILAIWNPRIYTYLSPAPQAVTNVVKNALIKTKYFSQITSTKLCCATTKALLPLRVNFIVPLLK